MLTEAKIYFRVRLALVGPLSVCMYASAFLRPQRTPPRPPSKQASHRLAFFRPFVDPRVPVFLSPNPARQRAFSLLDQDLDLVRPVRLLGPKYTGGRLEDGTGVEEREPSAPGLWDVGEVFFGEDPRGLPRSFAGECRDERLCGEVGQDDGNV